MTVQIEVREICEMDPRLLIKYCADGRLVYQQLADDQHEQLQTEPQQHGYSMIPPFR